MKILALVENHSHSELAAKHGLSLYIETNKHKILQGIHEKEHFNYGLGTAVKLIEENIATGYFRTAFSKDTLFALIFTFFDGFMRDVTLRKCYGAVFPRNITFEEDNVSEAFSSAVLSLISIHKKGRSK